ncbi:hypothetical protein K470DRAFT_266069 [Piedraia hortae CBS 480.64]|uniref:CFEM domain-containing protein n=1 Tax=Piedraia hortae CBS 480.64 TaxID=1314780 RepID=A0A6A7BT35_9PEZI|nr:hypothetical protein K470DRAFT_266069 [Piedraia hortae CBS 480.64]
MLVRQELEASQPWTACKVRAKCRKIVVERGNQLLPVDWLEWMINGILLRARELPAALDARTPSHFGAQKTSACRTALDAVLHTITRREDASKRPGPSLLVYTCCAFDLQCLNAIPMLKLHNTKPLSERSNLPREYVMPSSVLIQNASQPSPTASQSFPTASNSLSLRIESAVPECAMPCLRQRLNEQFQSCNDNDWTCLCTGYSSQGFTLGELAFLCTNEGCASLSAAEEVFVYSICSGQSETVSATHSTLTLLVTATGIDTASTPTSQTQSTSSIAGVVVLPSKSQDPHTSRQTPSPTPTQTAAATFTTPSPILSPSPVESTKRPKALNHSQAAAISFGVIAVVALLLCAIWFLVHKHRAKKKGLGMHEKRRGSYDFIDETPTYPLPLFLGDITSQRYPMPLTRREPGPNPQVPARKPVRSDRILQSQITSLSATSRPASCHERVRSTESIRTLSQLLPDRPNSTLPQSLPQDSPGRKSVRTMATEFEEDQPPSPSRAKLDPLPVYAQALPSQRQLVTSLPSHPSVTRKNGANSGLEAAGNGNVRDYYVSSNAGKHHGSDTDGLPLAPTLKTSEHPLCSSPPTYAKSDARPSNVLLAGKSNSQDSTTSFESSGSYEQSCTPGRKFVQGQQMENPSIPALLSGQRAWRQKPMQDSAYQGFSRQQHCAHILQAPSQQLHFDSLPKPLRIPISDPEKTYKPPGLLLASIHQGQYAWEPSEQPVRVQPGYKSPQRYGKDVSRRGLITGVNRSMPAENNWHETAQSNIGSVHSRHRHETRPRSPIRQHQLRQHNTGQSGSLSSPLWEPKLTPRKRGDELYLDVGLPSP